jgi:hypothetical protein
VPALKAELGPADVAVDGAGNVVESDGLSDRVRVVADETPIRVGPGPKSRKRYLLVACTNLLTYYFPGDRDTGTPGHSRRSCSPTWTAPSWSMIATRCTTSSPA